MTITEINQQPEIVLSRLQPSAGGLYVCPICGSGRGAHKTGALKYYASSKSGKAKFHCFACGVTLDCYDMFKTVEGAPIINPAPRAAAERSKPATDHKIIYNRYGKTVLLDPAASYLRRRGICGRTAIKFKARYNEGFNAIMIPQYTARGEHSGTTMRFIDEGAAIRYKQLAGSHKALTGFTDGQRGALFVQEGAFDAMSIYEACGAAAIATNGKSSTELLKMPLERFKAVFIVADNDKDGGGLRYAEQLANEIRAKASGLLVKVIQWQYHDTNDYLISDRAGLKKELEYYKTLANVQ